jgi:hypothetical protein
LVDVSIEKGNKESILQRKTIKNEEGKHMFMSVEKRYILFEQIVE